MSSLADLVAKELAGSVLPEIRAFAEHLATREGVRAVLFYGSILRTGDLDGVLDYYVLSDRPGGRGPFGLASRWLWPDVSYHELEIEGRILRAKVASMSLEQFRAAAEGRTLDTTIWARFVQPTRLVWTADGVAGPQVEGAVTAAAVTAARFAAALGPERGPADAFWTALFRQTYAAELRVEAPGRERSILDVDPARYAERLVAAWREDQLDVEESPDGLSPRMPAGERRRVLAAWGWRRRMGKPLNVARLLKAAFTFEGAARYAAWKIERHTGLPVPLTPWRERHPVLAAPGAMLRLWKAKRARS
ncbi:hypothetical protein [Caulobacter sp. NIBR2454]|uniref:hypothetical protein n=1 Tax=Caulobacter sp. NIBR2454 TaxID=3015996 RepID=UPI0022B615C1|nr:hypothetical protein [Caulobacter sp. NIBR2454]